MKLQEFRTRLETFEMRVSREWLRYYSGLSDVLQIVSVYSEFQDLCTPDAYREVQREIEQVPEWLQSRRKGLRKLGAIVLQNHLSRKSCGAAQQLHSFESRQRVPMGEGQHSPARIAALMTQESDPAQRRRLNDALSCGARDSEELRLERLKAESAAAAELGFSSLLEAYRNLTGIDYERLAGSFDRILSTTEGDYRDRLRADLEITPGIIPNEVYWCDSGYWRRQHEPGPFFQESGLVPALEETIARLGVAPEHADAILFDLEQRPAKLPHALCIPVRIPHEVHILLLPQGTYDDYACLFHESGHAHHFAWTSATLPIEERVNGDRALTETYGFLFERITRDRSWLREMRNFVNPSSFLRFQNLLDAYKIRLHTAKLRYEIELHGSGGVTEAAKSYADLMTRYTGFRFDAWRYLQNGEDPFYSADYLRAWVFEAMLRDHLRIRFGTAWFQSRAAGHFLKEIWETGQMYTAEEMSHELGLGPLDPQPLTATLREGLSL
jgi:hypothetical protein